jgi:hypothetical protein
MPASLESEPLPEIPAVQDMRTWSKEKVLRWIVQRDRNILEESDLDNFKKARIPGRAFLASHLKFFQKSCGMSPGVSLALKELADEVREGGKFIPQT